MPVYRWLQWEAWARTQGPLGALADDFHAARLLFATLVTSKDDERTLADMLAPWRRPSDYKPWGINLGDDPVPETFEIDG